MCKYTIAIPAFKAKFFEAALRSALNQDFTDAEVLVVDDASPEDLASIADRVGRESASSGGLKLRFMRNATGSGAMHLVRNWNICLQHARGKYFILMGDDDLIAPDALSDYEQLISQYPGLDVYHAGTVLIDSQGTAIRAVASKAPFEDMATLLEMRLLKGREQYIGDFCFDTEALRAAGGFYDMPLAWGSDDITVFRAAESKGIANSSRTTYFYRVSPCTISSDVSLTRTKLEATSAEQSWVRTALERLGKDSLANAASSASLCRLRAGEASAFDGRRVALVRAAVRSGAKVSEFRDYLGCRAMFRARIKVVRDRIIPKSR